ncbi:MAG: signal recognition particle-docking protein FtsY [Rickettsiaceae bacterium]|nr:signal recognition particle-docking protein FtsY [Rickettsiaceae bacterium]
MNLYNRLKAALVKTSNKINEGIDKIFVKKRLDQASLEQFEELLLFSDVGSSVSKNIIDTLKKRKFDKEVTSEEVKKDLAEIIEEMLEVQQHEFKLTSELNIILVCGVNGSGKTTTIGKLAHLYASIGKKVAVAACDTFRAAAVQQIEAWCDKSSITFYRGKEGADPASVAYNAVSDALKAKLDILFIDTAGRLHNHNNLMQELEKIIRVIKKIDINFPHHSLLIIDGTTGRNSLIQTEIFQKTADITGIIVTKLDGTSKAGTIINIVQNYKMPIHFIGIGENVADLRPFSVKQFTRALIGLEENH